MHERWKGVIILVISSCYQVNFVSSHCVMHGVCGEDLGDEFCFYNGTSISLEDNSDDMDTLARICPGVMDEGFGETCCSGEQLQSLELKFELSNALGLNNCPSCPHNFQTLWCMLTCSPRQSDFLKAEVYTNEDGLIIVEKLTYFISKSFAEGLFSSCKDIQELANGLSFLDMVCGDSNEEQCTVERMLKFLGSTPENGGYSNIEIIFEIVDDREISISDEGSLRVFTPMNESTFLCSERPFPGSTTCSCEDCKANCVKDNKSYFYDEDDAIRTMTDYIYEDTTLVTTALVSTSTEDQRKPQPTKTHAPTTLGSDAKHACSYPNNLAFTLVVLLLYYYIFP